MTAAGTSDTASSLKHSPDYHLTISPDGSQDDKSGEQTMRYRDGFTPCGANCSCAKYYELPDEVTQMEVNLAAPSMADVLTGLLGERPAFQERSSIVEPAMECEQEYIENYDENYDERHED